MTDFSPAGRDFPWTASWTFWSRLEPRTRDATLSRTLRSEVHDPAWLLFRQWQVGEFHGEDAGSPIEASMEYTHDRLSRYAPGPVRLADILESIADTVDDVVGEHLLGGVDLDAERARLLPLRDVLGAYADALATGGQGDPDAVVAAFEDWLAPEATGTLGARRAGLAYLARPLLTDDAGGAETAFDRMRRYLDDQPASVVTVAGVRLHELVTQLEAFVDGAAGWVQPRTTFDLVVRVGDASVAGHLFELTTVAKRAMQAAVETREPAPEPDHPPAAFDYDGGPLEALVEREPVATAAPNARLRVDAGGQFLRSLAAAGYGECAPADFPGFGFDAPEEPLDPDSERFVMVTGGRAIDGHAVFEALRDGVANIEAAAAAPSDAVSWSTVDLAALPLPAAESATTAADLPASYVTGATSFYRWYADLYDEPGTDVEGAWQPDRLEYNFRVATGPRPGSYAVGDGDEVASGETVFAAREYPGGRLDWYAFDVVDSPLGRSLGAPADETLVDAHRRQFLPTKATFPGMPRPRWWEFEDGRVSLEELTAGPENLSRLLLLDFALVYGNDWYVVPVEAPVGSLTRITQFEVTDTFGEVTTVDPVSAHTDDWRLFGFDGLPESSTADGEPGLFLPPVLGTTQESDPTERVTLSRDEMANLAFAVEDVVESAAGAPLRRDEFRQPRAVLEAVCAGPDAEDESVTIHNVGNAHLDVGGWTIQTDAGDVVYTFPTDDRVPADGTVVIHTGSGTDAAGHRYAGRTAPVWETDEGSVTLYRGGEGSRESRFVAREPVVRPPAGLPDYRLVSDLPDHWFPLKPTPVGDGVTDDYRLTLARLLDADTIDDVVADLPAPRGRVLTAATPLRLYEEEVPRDGVEVTRSYQLARWSDGSSHLWAGRHASAGGGERASGLRFDALEEDDAGTARLQGNAAPPATVPAGTLRIREVEPRAPGWPARRLDEEYVVFENDGATPLDVSRWRVTDEVGTEYEFPTGTVVQPGGRVTLRTGHGEDSAVDRFWGRNSPVWNDGGDTVYVFDETGTLVARHGYPVPSEPVSATPLELVEVHSDPPAHDGEDLTEEYVVFENTGETPLDLSEWRVADIAGHVYEFAEGTTLAPGARLSLRTGRGSDTETDRYWGSTMPIWNNRRDVVHVYDADGDLVLRRAYRGDGEFID